jgi:hypothetical protein
MLDPSDPDGFKVNSFAGDDWAECKDYVRSRLELPARALSSGRRDAPARPRPNADDEDERRAAWIWERIGGIWHEARNPRGTIVEQYLTQPEREGGRGLAFPNDVAGSALRFHPACPWKDESGKLIRVPAMIAAMRCIHTDRLRAIHRTRLTPDGRKVDRRMLGNATEVAIKLDPDEAVTIGLAVGEGIETCLATRHLGYRPVWGLGSASHITGFPVVNGIEAITLLAENDDNGANDRAIEASATRWLQAGREVLFACPDHGKDMNDVLHALNARQGRAA